MRARMSPFATERNDAQGPPACRAFQMATTCWASTSAFRLASARLASAAARAAARSVPALGGLGQTTRDRAAADVLPLPLFFDPGGGGVGWRRAITGFGSTYVTSGEYQCSRLIETRIGIKRGV